MATRRNWERPELLAAFKLYCQLPFGKLSSRTPEIIKLANSLGRTAGAVSMKACNFASLDPLQRQRGIVGLSNVSEADRLLWNEFQDYPTRVAEEAEEAYESLDPQSEVVDDSIGDNATDEANPNETEYVGLVKIRRAQYFFRKSVLSGYGYKCALSGIDIPELLVATHIIPWKDNVNKRADPSNGIALNALYSAAFIRGYITLDDSFRVIISNTLQNGKASQFHQAMLNDLSGRSLTLPERFVPNSEAITYHRTCIFNL